MEHGSLASSSIAALTSGPQAGAPIDANGNLSSDGTRTFAWDARNQLVAVSVGTHRSEFSCDGDQCRVRIIGKENGVVQSDTQVLWCETAICEERAADGATVTRRAFGLGEPFGFAQGEQVNDQARRRGGGNGTCRAGWWREAILMPYGAGRRLPDGATAA